MFEECAPPIPVARMLDRGRFDDAVGCVEAAASNDIKEITFLGSCLMYNDATLYDDTIRSSVRLLYTLSDQKKRETCKGKPFLQI